jgi:hypothetical protein
MNIQLRENEKARILDASLVNDYREASAEDAIVRSQTAIYDYLKEKEYEIEPSSH